ncbi:MAG: amidohydrolase family protein [Lachnospiraceae bacterium]|nr:amidohydrolase family protein [Lachnospiraceae bacterium]
MILKNCRLLPELTEGTGLTYGDVHINGKFITDITPCGSLCPTDDIIDACGQTLLPGLIDAHLHAFIADNPKAGDPGHSAAGRALDGLRYARYLLKNGYTTIRNCSDHHEFPIAELRDQINAGYFTGPTILTSGPILIPRLPWSEKMEQLWGMVADGAEGVRQAADFCFSNGADFLKVYGTGSLSVPDGKPGASIMTKEEIEESARAAKAHNSYAAIHCHGAECIHTAVQSGIRTIEHATFISEETLQLMEGRQDVGIVPTLYAFNRFLKMDPKPTWVEELLEQTISSLKNAYRHNILIGWGTDVPMSEQLEEVGKEFRLRSQVLGYQNMDLLKQATINTAKLMMIDDTVGSVRVGKHADLILVDGRPDEDISLMYTAPAMVIKHGRIVK